MVESVEKVRNKVRRVRRPSCNWFQMMNDQEDARFSVWYWKLKSKHPKMSDNRIAFNVLKRYYSTTSLNRVRWLGVSLLDEPQKEVNDRDLFSSDVCVGSRL